MAASRPPCAASSPSSTRPTGAAPPGVLAAPGTDVPTTLPGSRWAMVSGASYAAAHVSGPARPDARAAGERARRRALRSRVGSSCAPMDASTPVPACSRAGARRLRPHRDARATTPGPDVHARPPALRAERSPARRRRSPGRGRRAQPGGSVAVDSDYRYRGVSLSDEQPSLRLTLNYDASERWYAGASRHGREAAGQRQLHAAARLRRLVDAGCRRPGLELGRDGVHFGGDSRLRLREAYAGLLGERWNMRLYFARTTSAAACPHGLRRVQHLLALDDAPTFAHFGALVRVGGAVAEADRTRVDVQPRRRRSCCAPGRCSSTGSPAAAAASTRPSTAARPGTLVLSASFAF